MTAEEGFASQGIQPRNTSHDTRISSAAGQVQIALVGDENMKECTSMLNFDKIPSEGDQPSAVESAFGIFNDPDLTKRKKRDLTCGELFKA